MYRLVNMGLKISHSVSSWLCVLSHFILRLQKKCLRLSRSRDENLIACLSNFFIRKFPSDGWKRKKKFRLDNFFLQEKVSFLLCLPPSFLFCYSHLWKKFDWIAKQWVLAAGQTMGNHQLLGESSVAGGKARSFDGCLKFFCMIQTR